MPSAPSRCQSLPVWLRAPGDGGSGNAATRLTIGIQRRLTKPFHAPPQHPSRIFRKDRAFCRRGKSGLPSHPPNHKSDSGSLQFCSRFSARSLYCGSERIGAPPSVRRRCRIRRLRLNFAGVARGGESVCVRKTAKVATCAGSVCRATSWSGCSGLWFKKVR